MLLKEHGSVTGMKILIVGSMVAWAGAMVGCANQPAGPLDSRLVGTWESRRGFVGTDTLEFKSDGTLTVTSFDGDTSKSYRSQWFVSEPGQTQLKLSMQAQGKPEYRMRRVKFLEDGSFEMREGNSLLGRFEKKQ